MPPRAPSTSSELLVRKWGLKRLRGGGDDDVDQDQRIVLITAALPGPLAVSRDSSLTQTPLSQPQ